MPAVTRRPISRPWNCGRKPYSGPAITLEVVQRVKLVVGPPGTPNRGRFLDPITGHTFSQTQIVAARKEHNWRARSGPVPDAWTPHFHDDFHAEYTTLIRQATRYARRWGLSDDLAYDSVHSAFLVLAESADYMPRPRQPGAFLWRAVQRQVEKRTHYNRARERNEHWLISEPRTFFDIHQEIDTGRALDRANRLLTEKQQRAAHMYALLGMSQQEIAGHEGVTLKAVNDRIRFAFKKLRADSDFCRWLNTVPQSAVAV